MSKSPMVAAYEKYLAKMVSRGWLKRHPDTAGAWWKAGIVGGMFRAGVRYGRVTAKVKP